MTKAPKSTATSLIVEIAVIVVVAVGVVFGLQAWVVKPYQVPSDSMEPTIQGGDRILADRIGMHFGSPKIGDIMVFHPPVNTSTCSRTPPANQPGVGPSACDSVGTQKSSTTFVKRVVGLPGDHLRIVDGHVYDNGKREADKYITACLSDDSDCNFPGTIVVPKGDYYLMGDNRPDSQDSRFWGPVPKSWLIGSVFFRFWPPDRIGTL